MRFSYRGFLPLTSQGVHPGDRVTLAMPQPLFWVVGSRGSALEEGLTLVDETLEDADVEAGWVVDAVVAEDDWFSVTSQLPVPREVAATGIRFGVGGCCRDPLDAFPNMAPSFMFSAVYSPASLGYLFGLPAAIAATPTVLVPLAGNRTLAVQSVVPVVPQIANNSLLLFQDGAVDGTYVVQLCANGPVGCEAVWEGRVLLVNSFDNSISGGHLGLVRANATISVISAPNLPSMDSNSMLAVEWMDGGGLWSNDSTVPVVGGFVTRMRAFPGILAPFCALSGHCSPLPPVLPQAQLEYVAPLLNSSFPGGQDHTTRVTLNGCRFPALDVFICWAPAAGGVVTPGALTCALARGLSDTGAAFSLNGVPAGGKLEIRPGKGLDGLVLMHTLRLL